MLRIQRSPSPQPATLMKLRAPRVFRWTEAMNTPEIQTPEFPDVPTEFAADDVLTGQTLELPSVDADAGEGSGDE